jgi:hypothetical protein
VKTAPRRCRAPSGSGDVTVHTKSANRAEMNLNLKYILQGHHLTCAKTHMPDKIHPNAVSLLAIIIKELASESDLEDNLDKILLLAYYRDQQQRTVLQSFSGTGGKIDRTPGYLQHHSRSTTLQHYVATIELSRIPAMPPSFLPSFVVFHCSKLCFELFFVSK